MHFLKWIEVFFILFLLQGDFGARVVGKNSLNLIKNPELSITIN